MNLLVYIALAVIVVLCVFLIALVHAGFFYSLLIRKTTPLSAPCRVAYKLYRGAYSNAGSAFKDLSLIMPNLKTFGIYYDDPKKVL